MRFNAFTSPIILSLLLGLNSHAPALVAPQETPEVVEAKQEPKPSFLSRCKPLADLIAKGEGDWDSVNRGRAGDTPGGIRSIAGKSFSDMTVGEVIRLQRYRIYAVGRYQFIPRTLRQAVGWAGVKHTELFNPYTQDKLFAALLEHKRPAVGQYLRGGGSLQRALDALAREWASVAYRGGRSYYAGWNGNRAHITRHEATVALNQGRGL